MDHLPDPRHPLRLDTPRGTQVPCVIGWPHGLAPAPALVIAPGKAYTMDQPLIRGLFERALALGFVVARFDWGYTEVNGQPSPALVDEIADMQTVVAALRRDPRVDPGRVFVAGKSIGSIVAHHVLTEDPEIRGELLLTPVCPEPGMLATGYPGLVTQARPAVLLVGDEDTVGCPLPHLYEALRGSGGQVALVVTGGDHSLELSPEAEAHGPTSTGNLEVSVAMAGHWLALLDARARAAAQAGV